MSRRRGSGSPLPDPRGDEEWRYGFHSVAALLDADSAAVLGLWVARAQQDDRARALLDRARAAGIACTACERADLDARFGTDTRHQGFAALCRRERSDAPQDLDDLLDRLDEPPFLLVLDGIQDPHNLGACLRSADAAGVHAVIVPRDRAAGMTPVVRKVACGAAETVPFFPVTNLARTLKGLQDRGVWITGTDAEAPDLLWDVDLRGPAAIVIGSEGEGMRRLVREHCDRLARLPLAGTVSSLNASVAVGICLFEAVRQRR